MTKKPELIQPDELCDFLILSQIEPFFDAERVTLKVKPDFRKKIIGLAPGIPEKARHYFSPLFDEEDNPVAAFPGESITMNSDDYRSQCEYAHLCEALRDLAPCFQNARFFMSPSESPFLDEVRVERGQLSFVRHRSVSNFTEDKLNVCIKLLGKKSRDIPLKKYVSHRLVDAASFDVEDLDEEGVSIRGILSKLNKALEYFPQNQEAYYQKARIDLFRKAEKKAMENLNKVLDIQPGHIRANLELGKLTFGWKKYKEAILKLEKAVKNASDGLRQAWIYLGAAYELTGNGKKAHQWFTRIIQETPPHQAGMIYTEGTYLWQWGLSDSSRIFFEKTLTKADACLKEINQREKKKSGETTFFEGRRNTMRLMKTNAYNSLAFLETNNATALRYLNKAQDLSPGHLLTWFNKGVAMMRLEKHQEAHRCFDMALSFDGNHWGSLINKAHLYLKANDHVKALQLSGKLLELNPKSMDPWIVRGWVYRLRGQYQEALRAYNRVIKLDPRSEKGYQGVGWIYSWMKKPKRAVLFHKKCLAITPDCVPVISNLASDLNNLGRHKEGLRYAEKAIQLQPDYYHPYYIKACVYAKEGNVPQTLAMIQMTLKRDPTQIQAFRKEKDFARIRKDPRLRHILG